MTSPPWDAARAWTDGEAEAGSAGVAIARGLQPMERFEHRPQLMLGNAGPLILDPDHGGLIASGDRGPGGAAELERVVDQICEQPLEGQRIARHIDPLESAECQTSAELSGVVHGGFDQRRQLEALTARRRCGVADEAESAGDHGVHLLYIGGELVTQFGGRLLGAELQAGQGRAKIVGDRGDHGGALGDVALQTRLHLVVRGHGGGDLGRSAANGQRRCVRDRVPAAGRRRTAARSAR